MQKCCDCFSFPILIQRRGAAYIWLHCGQIYGFEPFDLYKAVEELDDGNLGVFAYFFIHQKTVAGNARRGVDGTPPNIVHLKAEYFIETLADSANLEPEGTYGAIATTCLQAVKAGQLDRCGTLFRDFIKSNAKSIISKNFAENYKKNMSKFGKRGEKASIQKGNNNRTLVFNAALLILTGRGKPISKLELANEISKTLPLGVSTIRRAIDKLLKRGDLPTDKLSLVRKK